jgi:hypothetical protein
MKSQELEIIIIFHEKKKYIRVTEYFLRLDEEKRSVGGL